MIKTEVDCLDIYKTCWENVIAVLVFFLIGLDVVAYRKDHYFLSMTLYNNIVNMAAGEILWHPWLAVELRFKIFMVIFETVLLVLKAIFRNVIYQLS